MMQQPILYMYSIKIYTYHHQNTRTIMIVETFEKLFKGLEVIQASISNSTKVLYAQSKKYSEITISAFQ